MCTGRLFEIKLHLLSTAILSGLQRNPVDSKGIHWVRQHLLNFMLSGWHNNEIIYKTNPSLLVSGMANCPNLLHRKKRVYHSKTLSQSSNYHTFDCVSERMNNNPRYWDVSHMILGTEGWHLRSSVSNDQPCIHFIHSVSLVNLIGAHGCHWKR